MWLVMRGALSANVTETRRDYYLPSMTGIATLILRTMRACPRRYPDAPSPAYGAAVGRVEKLPGTYPFTHERNLNGLRLNRFLHRLIEPAGANVFCSRLSRFMPKLD